MMKYAGIMIQNWIESNNLDVQFKLQVHDEYVFQIPKGRSDIALKLKELMEEAGNTFLTGCKMESSMEICNYWKK